VRERGTMSAVLLDWSRGKLTLASVVGGVSVGGGRGERVAECTSKQGKMKVAHNIHFIRGKLSTRQKLTAILI
jgi:hypothetical protein